MNWKTAALSFCLMLQAGCSGCGTNGKARFVKVRWPASAPIDLEEQLAATRLLQERKPAPGEPLPQGLNGVRVRDGWVDDLYYIEAVMGDADFDTPLPMVVLLHGRGDRPRVPGGPFGRVPTPFRLIMPRAPTPLGEGFSWLSVSITHGRPDDLARDLVDRANHLAVFIEDLVQARPILGRPIVSGFSQGAMLTYTLAVQRPDFMVFAFPLVGWLPPGLWPDADPARQTQPIIRSVHGTADPIIPIDPARNLVKALQARHWQVELQEFPDVAHTMTAEMNATFETWLEAALKTLAPEMTGGLGEPGAEPDSYEPFEPLEAETLEAIEAFERQAGEETTDTQIPGDATDMDGPDDGAAESDGPVDLSAK